VLSKVINRRVKKGLEIFQHVLSVLVDNKVITFGHHDLTSVKSLINGLQCQPFDNAYKEILHENDVVTEISSKEQESFDILRSAVDIWQVANRKIATNATTDTLIEPVGYIVRKRTETNPMYRFTTRPYNVPSLAILNPFRLHLKV
jgi:hypothetical protein